MEAEIREGSDLLRTIRPDVSTHCGYFFLPFAVSTE